MIFERIHLNKFYNLKHDPVLEILAPECRDVSIDPRKCMVVVPGGAYWMTSKREGDPIAMAFMLKGYVTCVLSYSTKDKVPTMVYPDPQLELMATIDYMRRNAKAFNINPDKIGAVGFSAGGHLVASVGYLYKDKDLLTELHLNEDDVKPNYVALGYPVISFLKDCSVESSSRNNLTNNNESLFEKLSCQLHVDSSYPMTYIWATNTDNIVPIKNTIMFDEALTKAGVKHKTVIFPKGPHGLSLNIELTDEWNVFKEIPEVTGWLDDCADFFQNM